MDSHTDFWIGRTNYKIPAAHPAYKALNRARQDYNHAIGESDRQPPTRGPHPNWYTQEHNFVTDLKNGAILRPSGWPMITSKSRTALNREKYGHDHHRYRSTRYFQEDSDRASWNAWRKGKAELGGKAYMRNTQWPNPQPSSTTLTIRNRTRPLPPARTAPPPPTTQPKPSPTSPFAHPPQPQKTNPRMASSQSRLRYL